MTKDYTKDKLYLDIIKEVNENYRKLGLHNQKDYSLAEICSLAIYTMEKRQLNKLKQVPRDYKHTFIGKEDGNKDF